MEEYEVEFENRNGRNALVAAAVAYVVMLIIALWKC